MKVLREPIRVQRPALPWWVRLNRQRLAGIRRLGGRLWPVSAAGGSTAGGAESAQHSH
jgi:hypothetical protein